MKLSLSKINFFNIIGIVITFSVILSLFIYSFTDTLYQQKIIELEKNYFNKNKALVQNEVKRAVTKIDIIKNITYKNNEHIIKEKVNYVHDLLSSDSLNDTKALLSKYENELNLINWKDKSGYFYIFDNNGDFLYYGGNKKFTNKNVFELSKKNEEFSLFIKKGNFKY